MKYEKKIILTSIELREIIMSAWVDGWGNKILTNDETKILYSANIMQGLIDENALR